MFWKPTAMGTSHLVYFTIKCARTFRGRTIASSMIDVHPEGGVEVLMRDPGRGQLRPVYEESWTQCFAGTGRHLVRRPAIRPDNSYEIDHRHVPSGHDPRACLPMGRIGSGSE